MATAHSHSQLKQVGATHLATVCKQPLHLGQKNDLEWVW